MMEYINLLQDNDVDGLEEFLKSHSVNECRYGQSLLWWAVKRNNMEFCQLLISHGADVNHNHYLGRSALSLSCFNGYFNITKLLLENGAIINSLCIDRAYHGWNDNIQLEILDLLRKYGWINLYLDGIRDCPRGFVLAGTVEEAICTMKNNKVHYLSLGYHLGEDDNGNQLLTGYDLVKYVCKYKLRPGNKIYIHTDNGVGREKMFQKLVAAYNKGFIDNDIEIRHYSFDGRVGK